MPFLQTPPPLMFVLCITCTGVFAQHEARDFRHGVILTHHPVVNSVGRYLVYSSGPVG